MHERDTHPFRGKGHCVLSCLKRDLGFFLAKTLQVPDFKIFQISEFAALSIAIKANNAGSCRLISALEGELSVLRSWVTNVSKGATIRKTEGHGFVLWQPLFSGIAGQNRFLTPALLRPAPSQGRRLRGTDLNQRAKGRYLLFSARMKSVCGTFGGDLETAYLPNVGVRLQRV